MTKTIHLIFDEDFRHEKPTVLDAFYEWEPLLAPVMEKIARHYNNTLTAKRLRKKHAPGYFVRMIMVNLKAGGSIPPHRDMNFSLAHGHRIHIPIITNKQVAFCVADQEKYLKEGEICEINNLQLHSVKNMSDEDRVHVITDWVIPGERCCCSKKTFPELQCSERLCSTTTMSPTPCSCYKVA